MNVTSVLMKQMRDALLDAYNDRNGIDALLLLIDRSSEAPVNADDLRMYVLQIIAKAKDGRWLINLFREALDDTPGNPKLQQVYQALQAITEREFTLGDPYEAWVLLNGDFLVDRRPLRHAIRDNLENEAGKRVIIVNGPRYSGRTNCISFLGHVKDDRGCFLIPIDLEQLALSGQLTVEVICTKIALQLGQPLSGNTEQQARQSIFFADWVAGQLNSSSKDCWIVFDHLDKSLLPDTVKDFISSLVKASKQFTKRLRIILLGLDLADPILGRLRTEFMPEVLGDIEDKAFTEFFAKFFAYLHHKHNLIYSDEHIAASVAAVVYARDNGDPKFRFKRQWFAFSQEIERLNRLRLAAIGAER